MLFDRHTPCAGFPLVLEGSVRVSTVSAAGRGIVLYRVAPGEGCILSGACLLGHTDHPATGVAETDVVLLRLPPALFNELMAQSEPFRRFVFDMCGTRLAEVNWSRKPRSARWTRGWRACWCGAARSSRPRTRRRPTNWAACACS